MSFATGLTRRLAILSATVVAALGLAAGPAGAADKINIGVINYVTAGPIFIAQQKGYFRDEGLEPTLKVFDSAQNVVVAVASRDLDFGDTAITAGLYNLAAKGAMKLIGGGIDERKGYVGNVIVVSKKAWDEGLHSIKDMKGHSFGVNTAGSSLHYTMARALETVGLRMSDVQMRILQTVGNTVSAVRTGQVDSAILAPILAQPLIASGEVKQIAVASDLVQYQVGGIFVATPFVTEKPQQVAAFVRAYQKGLADYFTAFLTKGPDGAIVYGPNADEIARIISRQVYGKDTEVAQVKAAAAYLSAGGHLDADDVAAQVKWYQANGFVDGSVDPKTFLDPQFIPFEKAH